MLGDGSVDLDLLGGCAVLQGLELGIAFSWADADSGSTQVSAYVDGEISAADLYRRTMSRYRQP